MKYNAKDATMCLPKGKYQATLEQVIDTDKDGNSLVSKSKGEPMEYLVFRVYSDLGERLLRSYIVESQTAWRYSVLAKAIDEKAKADFDNNTFDPRNYLGTNFTIELDVKDGPNGEQNEIGKIFKSELTAAAPKPASPPRSVAAGNRKPVAEAGTMSPDDIPF